MIIKKKTVRESHKWSTEDPLFSHEDTYQYDIRIVKTPSEYQVVKVSRLVPPNPVSQGMRVDGCQNLIAYGELEDMEDIFSRIHANHYYNGKLVDY